MEAVQKLIDEEFQGIINMHTSTLHKKIAFAHHDFFKLSGSENKLEALLQKNQVQNVLYATNFLGFVTGSISSQDPKILDSLGKFIPNPEFENWEIIDAHLLSFITATLSPPVFSFVPHLQHCSYVWNALEKRYTSLCRSHIHQLKNKLQTASKPGISMEEYLSQIKIIADQLSLASSIIDDEDLVLLTLNGLLDEYDALKTTIRAKVEPINMEELSSFLCSESIHMENKTKFALSTDSTVAYSATRHAKFSPSVSKRPNYRGRGAFRGKRGRYIGNRFSIKGTRGQQGQGNFTPGSYSSSYYQICGGYNHIAFHC
ncbi:uncharacterized protein LOC114259876 [Camellia sinensis]|uniref:uncharacterized protein LOC114259876 n=1 Tax=Camellia sinensis TaxID=4442 RepID=UPI0010356C61|nr:uncharacterized protein LOC114259876 [Camellia sinensis]